MFSVQNSTKNLELYKKTYLEFAIAAYVESFHNWESTIL